MAQAGQSRLRAKHRRYLSETNPGSAGKTARATKKAAGGAGVTGASPRLQSKACDELFLLALLAFFRIEALLAGF
jgi:hypothetical protein